MVVVHHKFPALGRQKQQDFCEFQALGYLASSFLKKKNIQQKLEVWHPHLKYIKCHYGEKLQM